MGFGEWCKLIVTLVVGLFGGGLLSKVFELKYKRKTELEDKQDNTEKRLDAMEKSIDEMRKTLQEGLEKMQSGLAAVTEAEKEDLRGRITLSCKTMIAAGWADFDDYENLKKLHKAYEKCGGNGDIDDLMKRVSALELRDSFGRRTEE